MVGQSEVNLQTVVKKTAYMIILFLLLAIVLFFNVGNYIDVTEKPVKSDLIACMGGGDIERAQKSVWLYNQGYSKQNILIMTGNTDDYMAYIKKHAPKLKLVQNPKIKNTAGEVRYIKKYMVKHHYKSVIIVSDPPHTRRIKILTNLISVKGDKKFSYVFVGSGVTWWHRSRYYQNRAVLSFALGETLKITYTYFYYGLMERLGIKWDESEYLTLKKRFNEFKKGLLSIVE